MHMAQNSYVLSFKGSGLFCSYSEVYIQATRYGSKWTAVVFIILCSSLKQQVFQKDSKQAS